MADQTPKRDLYEVLGVPRDATPKEIKKAYRAKSKEHHPDVAKEDGTTEAEARIKEINDAYGVLGDPEKRAYYDRFGGGIDTRDQAVAEILQGLFMSVITSHTVVRDPVEQVHQILQVNRQERQSHILKAERGQAKCTATLAKLKFDDKSGKQNVLLAALNREIEACKSHIVAAEENIALLDAAGEYLKLYGFEVPPSPARPHYLLGSAMQTTSIT